MTNHQHKEPMKPLYVLLDDEGNAIRYFDWQAPGTVKVQEPKYEIDWNNFEEAPF